MKRLIVALAATVMGICAASARNDFTTCDQFRDRLAKAEKVFGTSVPRFEFNDVDTAGEIQANDDRLFDIESARGLTGQLACNRRTGKLSSLQVDVYVFDTGDDKVQFNPSDRSMGSMLALTWAYTNWPKPKVQTAVKKMISDAHAELEQSELRRDATVVGSGTIGINHDLNLTYTIGSLGLGYMIEASISSAKPDDK
jgi:hypothetical protein